MLQMDMDGPTIEELVDPQLDDTKQVIFKREVSDIEQECQKICSASNLPTNQQNRKILAVLQKAIDKWREDEEIEGEYEPRIKAIEKFEKKRRLWLRNIENAGANSRERRERRYEDNMPEVPRRASIYQETDITRRTNTTGLQQQSYQGSSSFRRNEYSSDEDTENIPYFRGSRYSSPPRKYNQSSMYQQRRATSPIHQSQHTMNGTSNTQVRMRAGKSRVTKTAVRKHRPGQKALAEIRQYQKSTDFLIQKAPFARLVHEIVREATSSSGDFRVRADALMALQEGAEAFIVEMFEGSVLICNHAKRVTLMPTDIQLYRRLCLRNL